MAKLTLYHGSKYVIEKPEPGKGNRYNDYGQGFYCTEHLDLAKEWASSELSGGKANSYLLETEGLNILDLTSEKHNILNWLSLLLANRQPITSNPIAKVGKDYLLKNFSLPIDEYDLIIGYRADDSYFSFARAFLNNTISLDQLKHAMVLGKLGEQYVLKSQKAFDNLVFLGAEDAEHPFYYTLRTIRDIVAREDYNELLRTADINGLYLRDIMREEIRNEDDRLF